MIDLDDTCVPDRAATGAALAKMLCDAGRQADDAAIAVVLSAARTQWRLGPFFQYCLAVGISSWEGLWIHAPAAPAGFAAWIDQYQRALWAEVLECDPGDAAALAASAQYRRTRARFGAPFSDVPDALQVLALNHRLWLVTNGDSGLQRRKVELAGLAVHFDSLFVSGDIGAAKPADEFFDRVEAQLQRERCGVSVVIGDDIEKDIAPALARGWPAVHVQRGGEAADDGLTRVSSFTDLLALASNGWKAR